MLEAYIDESDTKDSEFQVLVLGGYVATGDQWEMLSGQWSRAIKKAEVRYFHSRKLRSGNARLFRHLDAPRRRELVSELSTAIADHVSFGVSLMVPVDAWKHSTTKAFRSRYGSLYGAAVSMLLIFVADILASPKDSPIPISIFLEDGHANNMDGIKKIKDYKNEVAIPELPDAVEGPASVLNMQNPFQVHQIAIDGYGLVEKRKSIPVQSADLLAYLVGAASRPPVHPVFDGVMDRLCQAKPHYFKFVPLEEIRLMADAVEAFSEGIKEVRQGMWRRTKELESLGVKVIHNKGQQIIDLRNLTPEQREKIIEIIGEGQG